MLDVMDIDHIRARAGAEILKDYAVWLAEKDRKWLLSKHDDLVQELSRIRDERNHYRESMMTYETQLMWHREALRKAEAALADIGDAEGPDKAEAKIDLKWAEARAAKALPAIREILNWKQVERK